MTYEVRALRAEERGEAWRLGGIAFGYTQRQMPENWTPDSASRHSLGAFDTAGRLVAKAVDREQGQWFGGRIVPTSGVAGVAVAPEARGGGLARLVLTRLLAAARDRGAAISTLFPTTPLPYRRLGWEEVGALTYLAVPATAFAAARPDASVTLRAAGEADIAAIHGLYRAAARAGTGLMERSGPMFDGDLLAEFDGVTVAAGPSGEIEGYASWERGEGYDANSKLTVYDFIAATPRALHTLLAMLGSWASVAPTIVLRVSYKDPAFHVISSLAARLENRQPWMLRVVDAPAAIAARGWPDHVSGEIGLELEDDVCPWNAGRYRLKIGAGEAKLEPGGEGGARLTPGGLALWYCGAATPDTLRRTGMLSGGDSGGDGLLHVATAGPEPMLWDYF